MKITSEEYQALTEQGKDEVYEEFRERCQRSLENHTSPAAHEYTEAEK